MAVTTEMVKELRERTGAGIKECKDTLTQTDGNMDQAIAILREKGLARADKKQSRVANEGRVAIYEHPGSKLVAIVEVNCETDFVARTEDFISLSRELALHVAATNPRYLTVEEVPAAEIEESGTSAEKFYEEHVLLAQPFVKNPSVTIQEKIKEGIAKLGENIVVRRFARFEVGS
ncbi:MAG: translation elongation factor Ts [Chloroflexaceae bacterium]